MGKYAKHKQVYFDAFDCTENTYIGCEICNKKAVDIHHIEARGMGGTKEPERIENLMALCRVCHDMFGDKKKWKDFMYRSHRSRMRYFDVKFDEDLMNDLIYRNEQS